MNNGEEEADKLVSILTDHRTSGQSKRQKKHEIQLSYSKSIHLHNSLLHEIKSLEGFKMGLKGCMGDPSTQSYNIELVVSKQDFGRGYVQGGCLIWQQVGFCCQRRGTWVTLLSLATEPQGTFRKSWTLSRASRIKWGQRQCIGLVTNCAFLGTASFPKTFANIFALQTGIKDFKFTMIQEERKTFPGNTGLKARGVSVVLL